MTSPARMPLRAAGPNVSIASTAGDALNRQMLVVADVFHEQLEQLIAIPR
jgi:hypothetical protein